MSGMSKDRGAAPDVSASTPPPGPRASRSALAARAAEIARIRRMTAMERISLALALGRRRRELEALRAAGTGKR